MIFLLLLFIVFIILVVTVLYININKQDNMVFVVSTIDNKEYLVRDISDKIRAANMLAKLRENMLKISDYLDKNKNKHGSYKESINQLNNRIYSCIISESSESSNYTSYTVNKGDEMIFCLRMKNNSQTIYDLNLLMYIVLHEMAHIGCVEYGHTDLFKDVFAFYTQIAIDLNLYTKIDFNKKPVPYCGMTITDSII